MCIRDRVSIASHWKNKSNFSKFTRNQITSEGLDAGYGSLIENYTDIRQKKKESKKAYKKESSESFHNGYKKHSKQKRSFLEPHIQTVNRHLNKENFDFNNLNFNLSTDGYSKNVVNRLYYRRNTADWNKKKSSSKSSKSSKKRSKALKATPSVKWSFHENYLTVHSVASSCKNLGKKEIKKEVKAKKEIKGRKSDLTSNESTPRIEDEDVTVNTITGGYQESVKNTFWGKGISFKNKFK